LARSVAVLVRIGEQIELLLLDAVLRM